MTTIIQLSDTHITAPGRLAYGRVDTHAALARAVAHLKALPARLGPIDAVVVSGDLTDLGLDAEYEAFRALTADLEAPLFVLPGNHDDRAALRRAFADAAYLPAGDGPLDYAVRIGALKVIALDTTVPGQSYGALDGAQLAWLDATLAADPGAPCLVFCHHPPFDTGVAHMDRQRLRDAGAFLEVLRAHPQLRLAAFGHVHRAVSATMGGVPCQIAPAPAHAVRLDLTQEAAPSFDLEPGAVLAHVWRGGALTSHVSYIGAFPGPFPFFGPDQVLLT